MPRLDDFMGYHGPQAKLSKPCNPSWGAPVKPQPWYRCTIPGCRKRAKSRSGLGLHTKSKHPETLLHLVPLCEGAEEANDDVPQEVEEEVEEEESVAEEEEEEVEVEVEVEVEEEAPPPQVGRKRTLLDRIAPYNNEGLGDAELPFKRNGRA